MSFCNLRRHRCDQLRRSMRLRSNANCLRQYKANEYTVESRLYVRVGTQNFGRRTESDVQVKIIFRITPCKVLWMRLYRYQLDVQTSGIYNWETYKWDSTVRQNGQNFCLGREVGFTLKTLLSKAANFYASSNFLVSCHVPISSTETHKKRKQCFETSFEHFVNIKPWLFRKKKKIRPRLVCMLN